jgi:hypothetical protein
MSSPDDRQLRVVRDEEKNDELDDSDFLDASAAFSEAGLREETTDMQPGSEDSGSA